jgi:uncharacterized damage-inducible protein DinB
MTTNPLSPEELTIEIKNVNRELIQTLSKFSTKELNKIQKEESWTAGQVTEHIIKSNGGILTQLLKGDANPSRRPFDEQVELIKNIFRSEDKMKTDPALEPSQPPHALEDLMKSLNQQKVQQLETINVKELKEVSSELQFPPAANGLTRYEWIIFMIEHTRRHGKQIENIYKEFHN